MRSTHHVTHATIHSIQHKRDVNNITQNQFVFLQRKTINLFLASEIVKTISHAPGIDARKRGRVKTNQCFCDVNMSERKILFFIFFVIIYCVYSVQMWFFKRNEQLNVAVEETNTKITEIVAKSIEKEDNTIVARQNVELINDKTCVDKAGKAKVIPKQNTNLLKDKTCSIVDVLTKKIPNKESQPAMNTVNNTVSVIGIIVFLLILVVNAALDVWNVKEEEKTRRRLNPDGERRQSLAEFANKKYLRRESSKFGLQLFQIAESLVGSEENKNNRRQSRPVTRGESTNSYLSEKKVQNESAPASVGEIGEAKLVKRQSVAKLFGLSDD